MPTDDLNTITIVPRSKSSDVLKKDSSGESTKTIGRLSHFSTLKQWGKNRFKFMNRSNEDKKENGIKEKFTDIDFINVFETGKNKNSSFLDNDRNLSHERKPSYSSSEKSLTIVSQVSQNLPASINPVKLRESSLNRRRYKDEPNSSSGNWSASSESGRTSIGSEFTVQPKSSASSNSLNHTHHLSSGPPSSIISRRRFFNTSASSSITSEGTVTPDLQIQETYDDGETSSVYSCDTEGYYTSFHVDSGLKTLKEEEPVTPLHTSSALSSNNSFGSTSNQTIVSAENEYELFGKGSTSTTTSSAGTICTTLMASGSDRNLVSGPAVPERKSSLSKFDRSNSTTSSTSSCNLERSYSTSTMGSSLERTGTIKRNGVLIQKDIKAIVHEKRIESPDSGHNTSSSPVNSNSSPILDIKKFTEFDYSESSDLEGVDRLERIRVKTTINSSRIPSMCVITPSNSDDENQIIKIKEPTYSQPIEHKKDVNHFRKATLLPLNSMLDRLKTVLPTLKKSPTKDCSIEPVYSTAGEYVTISDTRKQPISSNELIKRNLATVLSGNLDEETEYVSLNELPCNENNEKMNKNLGENQEEGLSRRGARVTLDAKGKVVFSSDSLKRRKGAHTTFTPGPFVKQDKSAVARISDRKLISVRPVTSHKPINKSIMDNTDLRGNKSNSLNSSSYITSGVLKGAYVNVQDSQHKNNNFSSNQLKGKNDLIRKSTKSSSNKIKRFSPEIMRVAKKVNSLSNENFDPNVKRRIITRSNSYRMANIDEVSSEKNIKIDDFENELKEELWRERINYPSCVSPKLSFIHKKIHEVKKNENNEEEINCSDSESDMDFNPTDVSYISLKPNKITIPADSEQNRARVLSFSSQNNSSNYTDIW